MGRSRTRSPSPGHSSSKRSRYSSSAAAAGPGAASSSSSSRRDDRDYDRRDRDSYRERDSRDGRDRRDRDRDYDRDRDRDRSRRDDRDARHSAPSSSRRRDDDRDAPPPSTSSSTSYRRHEGDEHQLRLPPSHYSASSSSSRPRSRSRDRYEPPSHHASSHHHHHSRAPSPPPPPPASRGPSAEELAEAEKQRRREKIALWKAQQAAKKAADGGGASPSTPFGAGGASPAPTAASASPAPASASPAPPLSAGLSLAGKGPAAKAPGLVRGALPLKASPLSLRPLAGAAPKPSRLGGAGLALDDGPTSVRKLEKLGDLPSVDMSAGPAAAAGDGADDEGEELEKEWVASVGGGRRGDERLAEGMDVDDAPAASARSDAPAAAAPAEQKEEQEEEDEDPLEAYMRSVDTAKSRVDAEDRSRTAGSAPKARKLGLDDDDDAAGSADDSGEEGDDKGDGPLTAEDIMAMAAKRNRRKDLAPVDHSKAAYEPFRKAFYTPPYEVGQLTDEEVELMRLEMDGIKIRGVDCPRPVKRWGAFGLPGGCLEIIKRLGYAAPTSIQAQAIPAIMSGRDVIGVAKTGSGKTIAFLLPLLRHIKDQRPLQAGDGPMAVVMTPTRELALQIVREAKPFCKVLNITAMCAYGGSPISEQIAEMKKGADLVVCTPGRMLDLLTANSGRVTNLKRVTYMVLDEADRMFDMGFEPQVMKIINNVRPDRQVVLFSATFPKQMDALARKLLVKPLEVTVGGRSVVAKEITQLVEVRAEETKFHRLLELLGETYQTEADLDEKRTLIFVERQEAADNLLLELHQRSYRRANSLHGGKEQVDRDQTLTNFKSGVIPIVIATSVAARGLDVKQLGLVINYDVPNHMEDYVHRAGRTGRAGNKGTCITFITPEQEKYSVDICRAVEASGVTPPPELKALSDGFLAKVRSGTAKSHSGTGFGGKGLDKFESEREARDKAERAAFGEDEKAKKEDGAGKEGADGTGAGDGSKDEKHVLGSFKVDIVKGPAPERVSSARGGPNVAPPERVAAVPPPLTASGKGLTKVEAALAKINAELEAKRKAVKSGAALNGVPTGPSADTGGATRTQVAHDRKPKDPDATDFHAVVQINDFIQKARWLVTNRDSMTKLIDLSGCAITNRGVYYAPGVEPPPGGEPKLALLVESNDEWRVELAVKEITRLLVEGTVIGLAQEQRNGTAGGGRYNVV